MILRCRPEASRISGSFWRIFESSSHLRSWPDATTALACFSSPFRMRISASSSAMVWAAVASIDELFFEVLLLLGVEVVVILRDVVPRVSASALAAAIAELLVAKPVVRAAPCGA